MKMVSLGNRAILLFVVQYKGIETVQEAKHIDPDYAELLSQAHQAGVDILTYCA